jgi:hypothetical protein
MEQNGFAPGQHPVAIILTDQSGVRTNLQSSGGMRYQEAVSVVPYVEFENPGDGPPGPFMYYPHLWLNSTAATLEGRWFYGFNKSRARIEGHPRNMTVEPLLFGETILASNLRPDGPEGHYYEFDHMLSYLPMVHQPVLGQTLLGDWVYSYLSYDAERGRVVALEGEITLGKGQLGFPEGKLVKVSSIRDTPRGAFEFTGTWTLTNPLESRTLKEILGKGRSGQG